MDKEHKKKIDKALQVCESSFQDISVFLDTRLSKEEAQKMKYFILENTIFAGGLFRSIFTDTKLNDVDIFFTSEDAALEFKHMVASNDKLDFIVSQNETFILSGNVKKNKPSTSFITRFAGDPHNLMRTFDFTINQHWFKLNTFQMNFNGDTFLKQGELIANDKSPIVNFQRMLRFMDEGFQFTQASKKRLAEKLVAYQNPKVDYKSIEEEWDNSGSSNNPKDGQETLHLTYTNYTEEDYFYVSKPDTDKTSKKELYKMVERPPELTEATLNNTLNAWNNGTMRNWATDMLTATATNNRVTVAQTPMRQEDGITLPAGAIWREDPFDEADLG